MAATYTNLARKKSALARKKLYLRGKNFYFLGRKPWFWDKKEEKVLWLWAFSSTLCKYTTFFGEIQMVLTFRNTPELLKCSDLQLRQVAMYYITRRCAAVGNVPHLARPKFVSWVRCLVTTQVKNVRSLYTEVSNVPHVACNVWVRSLYWRKGTL